MVEPKNSVEVLKTLIEMGISGKRIGDAIGKDRRYISECKIYGGRLDKRDCMLLNKFIENLKETLASM